MKSWKELLPERLDELKNKLSLIDDPNEALAVYQDDMASMENLLDEACSSWTPPEIGDDEDEEQS